MKAAILLLLVLTTPAMAADKTAKFTYQEITDPYLVSINSHDEKAETTRTDQSVIHGVYVNMQGQSIEFTCGLITPAFLEGTSPAKINDKGQIIGTCPKGNFDIRNEVAFIRERNGAMTIIQQPGADHTYLWGINTKGQAAGLYYNPLDGRSGLYRIHGLIYDKGKLVTVDLPSTDGRPPVTQLLGIDDAGRAIGVFFTFDTVTNETGTLRPFLYDNGQVTWLDFGLWTDVQDINALGTIVGNSSRGGFLWDDGSFYLIEPPTGKAITSVDSIDDSGRIVGRYRQDPCPVDQFGFPNCPSHQFIATPVVEQKGKGKGKDFQTFVDTRSNTP